MVYHMKKLFIAEKPSVARQFAEALDVNLKGGKGYIENKDYIFTWCVGHLVSMSYPEKYDASLKFWNMKDLPFIPSEYKYEVISNVKEQFNIVAGLLRRDDIETIYVCTDSGREGEYIYRLVDMMAKVDHKDKRRVWIDSQTKSEILRGIKEAKPESYYDNLGNAAFSRAKADYLMGINFSRVLTLKYGFEISRRLGKKKSTVVAAGRVMSCVLAMIVDREREIRNFEKTPFYRVIGAFSGSENLNDSFTIDAEFKPSKDSKKYKPSDIYKDTAFLKEDKAKEFIKGYNNLPMEGTVLSMNKKKERKYAPFLYNLAELQNDASRIFKIDPDKTLSIAQELYEKKLTSYPRTDARVLSTAVAKEISKNLNGLSVIPGFNFIVSEIMSKDLYKGIVKSKYTDDKKVTDHYALIPTGEGFNQFNSLKDISKKVYLLIVKRFLSIFYGPAVYEKIKLEIMADGELFTTGTKILIDEGFLKVENTLKDAFKDNEKKEENPENLDLHKVILKTKKGDKIYLHNLSIKEGETSPPKRYTSGSIILAMENAGNLIEDDDLRAQIKSCGIGTSSTRAGIITKLGRIGYIELNKKTQILSPTKLGEMIRDVLYASIRSLLNPELTASWELGLSFVEEGSISEEEYMEKLNEFIRKHTMAVKNARIY